MPAKASPPPSKENGDPMLQGTYVQEDAKDFEPPADEIAAFEQRLQHGAPIASHTHRHSAPAVLPAPHTSKPSAAPVSAPVAPSAGAQRGTGQRRMSEAEQEEAIQLQEDVDDVRQLDDRFGGAGDDSE